MIRLVSDVFMVFVSFSDFFPIFLFFRISTDNFLFLFSFFSFFFFFFGEGLLVNDGSRSVVSLGG